MAGRTLGRAAAATALLCLFALAVAPSAQAGGVWNGWILGNEFGSYQVGPDPGEDWSASAAWSYQLGAPTGGYWYLDEPREYTAETTLSGHSDITVESGAPGCRGVSEQHYTGSGKGTMGLDFHLDGEEKPGATYEVVFSSNEHLEQHYADCTGTNESSESLEGVLGFPGVNGVGWWPKGFEDLGSAKTLKGVTNVCHTPLLTICSQTQFEFELECVAEPEDSNANCVRDSAESGPDPCVDGQHGYATHNWSARVPLAGLPDAHFFDFRVNVPYCYNGQRARVNGPAAFGSVDYGLDTGLLEALGFETVYDPSKESVYASDFGTAELTGSFAITVSWATLIDRVGIKKLIKEKVEREIEDDLTRAISRVDVGRLRSGVLRKLSSAERKILDLTRRKFDRVKPAAVRNLLEGKVLPKLESVLSKWRRKAADELTAKRMGKRSASVISKQLVNRFFRLLDPRTTFAVWTPIVKVSVSPKGDASFDEEDDFKNPLLRIAQTE